MKFDAIRGFLMSAVILVLGSLLLTSCSKGPSDGVLSRYLPAGLSLDMTRDQFERVRPEASESFLNFSGTNTPAQTLIENIPGAGSGVRAYQYHFVNEELKAIISSTTVSVSAASWLNWLFSSKIWTLSMGKSWPKK